MKRAWTIMVAATVGAAACKDSKGADAVLPTATTLTPDTANYPVSSASPDGRRIAYWMAGANGWELRVAQSDMSQSRLLATATDFNDPLWWSPDGKHIAFASNKASLSDVWTVSPDSGEAMRVTTDPGIEFPLQWHPHSDRLAYFAIGDGGFAHTNVVGVAGGASAPMLAEKGTAYAFWSPDGSRIAYQRNEGGRSTIWLADSSGGNAHQLTSEGLEVFEGWGSPWSPDGRELAYVSRRTGTGDVWVVPVDGGKPRQLTHDLRDDVAPVWSPDGKWIAFVSDRGRQTDVWVVPSAGGKEVRVTDDEAAENHLQWMGSSSKLTYETGRGTRVLVEIDVATGAERQITPDSIAVETLDLSPDGKTIVYGANLTGGVVEIRTVPRAGGPSRTLIPGPTLNADPYFSPDGKYVAFLTNRAGNADTWIVDAAGGTPRAITSWPSEETDAEWSADSKALYVMSGHSGGAFYDIYRFPVDGGEPQQLTKTGSAQNVEPSRGNNALYFTGFGAKAGKIVLSQLMPDGTIKTLWDKSNVDGLSHRRISPSGDSLALRLEQPDGSFASVIFSARTGKATPILGKNEIAGPWSPDGTKILYYVGSPSADLGILNLKDGTAKPLTKTAANEGSAVWTPDSKSIVVVRSAPRRRIAVVDISVQLNEAMKAAAKSSGKP